MGGLGRGPDRGIGPSLGGTCLARAREERGRPAPRPRPEGGGGGVHAGGRRGGRPPLADRCARARPLPPPPPLVGSLPHPFFPSHVASGRCVLSAAAAGAPAGVGSAFAEPSRCGDGGTMKMIFFGMRATRGSREGIVCMAPPKTQFFFLYIFLTEVPPKAPIGSTRPGPRKETATRRHVTRGGGGSGPGPIARTLHRPLCTPMPRAPNRLFLRVWGPVTDP